MYKVPPPKKKYGVCDSYTIVVRALKSWIQHITFVFSSSNKQYNTNTASTTSLGGKQQRRIVRSIFETLHFVNKISNYVCVVYIT